MRSQQSDLNNSNLTKCREQKEKRADHDPPATAAERPWKNDPSSPYNHNIINNPLGMMKGYISDECKRENQCYDTKKGPKIVETRSAFFVATLTRASFSCNSIPTLSTRIQRIWIVQNATDTAQYIVAPMKLRMTRMNTSSAGRDLSPRRLQMEVRRSVKSVVWTTSGSLGQTRWCTLRWRIPLRIRLM